MKKIVIILLFVMSSDILFGQNIKFGKVSIEELSEKFYALDSTAPAAIIMNQRTARYDYIDGSFYVNDEYLIRIKIYKPEGYDFASVEIPYYESSESIVGLKANTYNLENGQIIKTELDKKNVFVEKTTKRFVNKKFTMPNLKEGSIIEYTYTLNSPRVTRLRPINLQNTIPIKKNLISVRIPDYLIYKTTTKGYLNIPLVTGRTNSKVFNTNEITYDIDMQDVPALKKEPYSGNIRNYLSGIVFEISLTRFPNSIIENYSADWKTVIKEINDNESFGAQLRDKNYFTDDLTAAIAGKTSEIDKSFAVFNFVKSKIKFNGYSDYVTDLGVKKSYKDGVGNAADINLNLVNMLRNIGIDANPVLISTIDNGIPLFPSYYAFDHVIAVAHINNENILLDATGKYNAMNVIDEENLNFFGYELFSNGGYKDIDIFPKKHSILKNVINIKFNEDFIEGNARKTYNNLYALNYRKEMAPKSKESQQKFLNDFYENIEILDFRISNMDELEKEVIESLKFQSDNYFEEISGKLFISPLLFEAETKNIFQLEKREYPIYFNKPFIENTVVNISIPEGYKVENVPENTELGIDKNLGGFQYKITVIDNLIKVESSIFINDPVIQATDYVLIKNFYKDIIAKHAEKIILSKL